MDNFKIFAAPVQGHTDSAWRQLHSHLFSAADAYFTPFMRVEKGGVRKRDVADLNSDREGLTVVPQAIFRNGEELRILVEKLIENGERNINLNIGCPFPLQTARGRGAAAVANGELLQTMAETVANFPEISFSAKMRLGMNEPDEWRQTFHIVNSMKLEHLTVHPRYARQQYGGEPDLEQFADILALAKMPIIYNGDLHTPEDVEMIKKRFPDIAGVMTGRGLLARPTLIEEIRSGASLNQEERIERMLRFHSQLLDHYKSTLCGDGQVLSKIKPFWEYAENEIGRKAWKAIKKATTMPKYVSAVALIGR